ncbi:MAG: hypothetical protein NTW09_03030 [Candidatus Omnitrophica bacterium]|nr:hypothetical protein [Candidatus Omnitrophota bacterium]
MNVTNTDMLLLVLMTIAALWTVMARSLLKATIGLAITSAVITILIFRLNSPLAAVFELSVCTGLITVIFVSTISLTKPLTHKEILEMSKARHKRYIYLPIILVATGIALLFLKIPNDFTLPRLATPATNVRNVMWNIRHLDLFGQIIIMMIGAFGVVTLFITKDDKDGS